MNVLISGCSFTHWPDGPNSPTNVCWPRYLQELRPDMQITNLAEPAAGNYYISNSIVRSVLEYPKKYDLVLVMWSGVSRLDFLTDVGDPDWNALFETYFFYHRVENHSNKLGYIFSGGRLGPWTDNPVARKLFTEMYKISDPCSLGHASLMEIIKTQAFLRSQNIPYRFMSYVNYWTHGEHISPNGDFGLLGRPELIPLINAIDWEPWIFSNPAKDGIYEMAKSAGDYNGDRFHPGAKINRSWAELVSQQLPV